MSKNPIGRAKDRSLAWLKSLLADQRGSGDITTYVLLTAAGAAMVAITLPSLFASSQGAANTFQNQVNVLERGAGGTGGAAGGGAAGGAGWTLNVGANGVSASGPGGSVSVSTSGVSGATGGGGGGAGAGAAPGSIQMNNAPGTNLTNGATGTVNGAHNPLNNQAQQAIIGAVAQ